MTETNAEERIGQLENRIEQLEEQLEELLSDPVISRRAALIGLGATGAAAFGAGLATEASASSDSDGSFGTADDPIGDLYVDHVYQDTAIVGDTGDVLWIGDNVDVEEMEDGDYLIGDHDE